MIKKFILLFYLYGQFIFAISIKEAINQENAKVWQTITKEFPLSEASKFSNDEAIKILDSIIDKKNLGEDKLTPLLYAISAKDIDYVKFLIEDIAYINKTDKYGRTALMYNEDAKIAKLLIDNGADINARDYEGNTALISVRDYDTIKVLLKNGARAYVNLKNKYNTTALMDHSSIKIKKLLIENGADASQLFFEDFYYCKNEEEMQFLINQGLDITKKEDDKTALIIACDSMKPNITNLSYDNYHILIPFLLRNGVDVNAVTKQEGLSALMFYIMSTYQMRPYEKLANRDTYINTFRYFVEKSGIDLDIVNKNGNTALIYAYFVKDHSVARELGKILIQNGASVTADDTSKDDFTGYGGDTVLMKALRAEEFDIKLISMMLRSGIDVNKTNNIGETALTIACKFHDVPLNIIELLIEYGADVNLGKFYNDTALSLLVRGHYQNINLIKVLLANGADINSKTFYLGMFGKPLNLKDTNYKNKNRLEKIAKICDREDVIELLHLLKRKTPLEKQIYLDNKKGVEKLLKNGENINKTDENGKTILARVIVSPIVSLEMIDFLLKNGADPNIADKEGKTPLIYLINEFPKYKHTEQERIIKIIKLLLENNVDINFVDKKGRTALIYLFYSDSKPINKGDDDEINKILELLLKNGADITIKDKQKKTVLKYAYQKLAFNAMKILREAQPNNGNKNIIIFLLVFILFLIVKKYIKDNIKKNFNS